MSGKKANKSKKPAATTDEHRRASSGGAEELKLGEIINKHRVEIRYIDCRKCLPGTNIRQLNPTGVEMLTEHMVLNSYLPSKPILVQMYTKAVAETASVNDFNEWKDYVTDVTKTSKYPVDYENHYSIIDGMHRVAAVKKMFESHKFLTPLIEATILNDLLTPIQAISIAQQSNFMETITVKMSLWDNVSIIDKQLKQIICFYFPS